MNLESPDSESGVLPITPHPNKAAPRGADPLPSARQADVQNRYTMAPNRYARNGPTRCCPSLKGFGDLSGRWTSTLNRWNVTKSGPRESNPCFNFGRVTCGQYTRPADFPFVDHMEGRTPTFRSGNRPSGHFIAARLSVRHDLHAGASHPVPGGPEGDGLRLKKNPTLSRVRGFGSFCSELHHSYDSAAPHPGCPFT